jgi:hypothetical protein
MKNSKDTIGNRSRDLPACSAVPETLRHRVPRKKLLLEMIVMAILTPLKTSGYTAVLTCLTLRNSEFCPQSVVADLRIHSCYFSI